MKHIVLILAIICLLLAGCGVDADEKVPASKPLSAPIAESTSSQAPVLPPDSDEDGFSDEGDNPDNCPDIPNANQADSDGDGIGDACDICSNDATNDTDGDNVCGDMDNCPVIANTDQADTDSDGIGDACDDCLDMDSDEVCDDIDNCPNTANPNQADKDGDRIGDVCDSCLDMDSDKVCDNLDNCPNTPNADQKDDDHDGTGDACDDCVDIDSDEVCDDIDNCPNTANPNQADKDGDGIGNVCDTCPLDTANDLDADRICGDRDTCPNDPDNDADGDGICGNRDNCPFTANPDQEDADGDRVGDSCDDCVDIDSDFICNRFDNCPDTFNILQADSDRDGIGDACDNCPNDPNKFYPGYCGCGTPDTDTDKDGTADCSDSFPNDPYNDSDSDGICGSVDNCPINANPDQADSNSDGIGDVCEVVLKTVYETAVLRLYPTGDYQQSIPHTGPLFHATHWDLVDDETPDGMTTEVVSWPQASAWSSDIYTHAFDESDYPEAVITKVTEYVRVHTSGSQHAWAKFLFDDAQLGLQEITVPEFDNNFTTFSHDFTSLRNIWSWDDIKACRFGISLRGQVLQGASCTQVYLEVEYLTTTYSEPQQPGSTNCPNDPYNDADGDGICGDVDNCPVSYNPYQADADGDGIGDECDGCLDKDLDQVCDHIDNCPGTPNGNQADSDHDGIGDVCDSCLDTDSDSICSNYDNCPNTYNLDQTDSDNDGIGDACDVCPFDTNNNVNTDGTCGDIETCPNDADSDGLCDNEDNCPNIPNPDQADSNGDGIGDACSSSNNNAWSYNVTYSGDPNVATNTTVWNYQSVGQGTPEGIDSTYYEVDFSETPECTYHFAPMNMDIIGTLTEYTTWKSIGDNELVSEMMQCSADTLLGYMQASIGRTYEYTGSHGIPFQVGENWSYVTTMSLPEYSYEEQQTWNAQVTAIEEITVPAGTFDCYKVVHTSADGTKTEWWSTNGQFNCPVKSIDDATFVGVQTFELTTYAEL